MATLQADKVKEGRDRIFHVERCPFPIDADTKILLQEMAKIELREQVSFSLGGGFARDSLLGYNFNDYDISSSYFNAFREPLHHAGILIRDEDLSPQERLLIRQENPDGQLAHDYFINPWDLSCSRRPIHWIHTEDLAGFAHSRFDVSINEFCLKSDGNLYAPTYSWRDLEKRVIRINRTVNLTINNVFRAVRFAAKYDFTFHSESEERIQRFVQVTRRLATKRSLKTLHTILQEGKNDRALEIFQRFDFAGARKSHSLFDYLAGLKTFFAMGEVGTEPDHY